MTAEESVDAKEVIFINPGCEDDYVDMPDDVQETAVGVIDDLQNGRTPSPTLYAHLTNDKPLAGISYVTRPYGGDTYRVYLWCECPHAVFVLDAGKKKSPSGKGIPPQQKERLARRLAAAKRQSAESADALRQSYEERAERRARLRRTGK